jgi:dTDP-D-glucose 4,6-dehydratase
LGKKAKTKRVGKILGDVEITKSPSENKGVSLEEGIRKTVDWYREYTRNGKRDF